MSDFADITATLATKDTLEEKLKYCLSAIAVLTTHKKAVEGMMNDILNIPGVLELVEKSKTTETK